MDLQMLNRVGDFSRRRRKWILLFALFGTSAYGAYKVYHSPTVTRKRRRLTKLIGALFSLLEIVSDSAETFGVVSRDLKEFLSSDSDEIPNSLKQMSKIAQSQQFYESVTRMSEALTIGILRGYRSDAMNENKLRPGSSITDRVMDRVLSSAGTGFVSVVAGSFARNLVLGYYASREQVEVSNIRSRRMSDPSESTWADLLCNDKFKDVMADCIQKFVGTAVAAYLDKTLDVNVYDELFAGLTNPKHEGKLRDMLVVVCNGAVETLVKTSHQVLTERKTDPASSSYSATGDEDQSLSSDMEFLDREENTQSRGLVASISSTLVVPGNRRFVLDMTGRLTYETLRSIVNFLLWTLADGLGRRANVARDQVVNRGLDVVRYFSAKSSVIVTLCLALYLHVMGGTRPLLAA